MGNDLVKELPSQALLPFLRPDVHIHQLKARRCHFEFFIYPALLLESLFPSLHLRRRVADDRKTDFFASLIFLVKNINVGIPFLVGDLKFLVHFLRLIEMKPAAFLNLPMHAGGALIINLHAINADVSLSIARIAGEDLAEGDKSPAIIRPAFLNGQGREIWFFNNLLRHCPATAYCPR
jgi:hypothetical protein